jgi:hypothetical protein
MNIEGTDIIKSLPKCTLVDVLIKKARERTDSDFNYILELEHFRHRVKQDINDIRLLFPEYTPHDEQYHLKPLFHLASKLLGKRLPQELNATELFLLACALYGHDWGMAVSTSEKQNIVGGQPSKENDTTLEQEERREFHKFAREHGYTINGKSPTGQIPISIWREYVRQTHAIRSARRIRKHFETIDTGVSLRLAQICESHCLDYEVLRDPIKYPVRGSVLGEFVNIRAIAIYLRLIDLLDFADNRTPYIIWKFVAPRDPRSVIEWDKHRALRQVTFPPYQKGQRQILVDGSTNDHEVYAALQDLKDYCEKQFRGCTDLLSEMPDQRYTLDLSHITWRVEADNFRPISVQFQFDRERMLEFLSQDLYQAEKYVFLRELLQNSIDAIRMRRAILRSQEKRSMNDFGEIHVRVEYNSSGFIDLTWTDNGIGMDEYIVENYLAVIGKSYYQSDDFLRLGIPIDPISRFGIGILTCFMVSDSIEITTKKDRNLPPPSDALKIKIPALNRRFRIEVVPDDIMDVGTTVKLIINPMKSSLGGSPQESSALHVTDYLRRIAGFVEFPIVIDEHNNKTVIIHPYQNVEEAQKRFGNAYDIVKLNLDYPWEEAVFSEDLATALQIFAEESFDIGKDLGLADYEGVLSYPVPIDKNMDFTDGLPGHHKVTVLSGQPGLLGKSTRWMWGWNGQLIRNREDPENENEQCSCNAIYRDGILLSKASFALPARTKIGYIEPAKACRLVVNLSKSRAQAVDLARNLVITDSKEWATPIFEAHGQALARRYSGEDFYRLPLAQQLFQLASLMLFHNVSTETLSYIYPRDSWPLPFLEQGGHLTFKRWAEVKNDAINRSPEPLSTKLAHLVRDILKDGQPPEPLIHWIGPLSIIDFATWGGSVGDSSVISGILEFVRVPLSTSHRFGGIRFLSPPWEGFPPLLQEIWAPGRRFLSETDIERILKQVAEDPIHAVYAEEEIVQQKLCQLIGIRHSHLRMSRFPSPFEKAFAYGNVAINLENPIARALICLTARLIALEMQESQWPVQRKQIQYALRAVFLGLPGGVVESTYEEWKKLTLDLWSMARQMKLTEGLGVDNLAAQLDDFVPGSHERFLSIKVRDGWNKPFGQELR